MRPFFSRTDRFWVGLSDLCCLNLCLKVSWSLLYEERVVLSDSNEAQNEAQMIHHCCFMVCLMQIRESNSSSCLKLCFIFHPRVQLFVTMRHRLRQQKSETPTVTHRLCPTLCDHFDPLMAVPNLLLVPGCSLNES